MYVTAMHVNVPPAISYEWLLALTYFTHAYGLSYFSHAQAIHIYLLFPDNGIIECIAESMLVSFPYHSLCPVSRYSIDPLNLMGPDKYIHIWHYGIILLFLCVPHARTQPQITLIIPLQCVTIKAHTKE